MSVFRIKTAIHHGPDALGVLSLFDGQRVLIVTDPFLASSPLLDLVRARLPKAQVTVFSKVVPDPGLDVVRAGLAAFYAADPQALIAFGGGSSMDAAKAIHRIVREQGNGNCACIAIPTTSGSGSEVTSVAVITDEKQHRKLPLVSQTMLPDIAILDPELTMTVPPSVTADTGLDALTHAVEAFVATGASDFTDALAQKAIELIFEFLPLAVANGANGANAVARERMHNASNMAALAFDHAGLGITHSLAHAIGGTFHQPHGRLNAILLPFVIEFNAGRLGHGELSSTAARYAYLGKSLHVGGGSERNQVVGLVTAIRRLARGLGVPAAVTALGIDKREYLAAVPQMVTSALADACTTTNPVPVSADDLARLFTQAG